MLACMLYVCCMPHLYAGQALVDRGELRQWQAAVRTVRTPGEQLTPAALRGQLVIATRPPAQRGQRVTQRDDRGATQGQLDRLSRVT